MQEVPMHPFGTNGKWGEDLDKRPVPAVSLGRCKKNRSNLFPRTGVGMCSACQQMISKIAKCIYAYVGFGKVHLQSPKYRQRLMMAVAYAVMNMCAKLYSHTNQGCLAHAHHGLGDIQVLGFLGMVIVNHFPAGGMLWDFSKQLMGRSLQMAWGKPYQMMRLLRHSGWAQGFHHNFDLKISGPKTEESWNLYQFRWVAHDDCWIWAAAA